ncbi:GNAT family N-acetyltransferase [Micromonospora sp. NPDC049662]|uniref:GNAT family N-acetyltransferase n=1 Tax=Micromonospora sp. NPDC049662 TaxID=3155397 RepID=UPI0034406D6E
MSRQHVLRQAQSGDLEDMIALRIEAEQWLSARGIRQWTPDYDEYARSALAKFVDAGMAWIVEIDGQVIATASLNEPDPDFWGWADDQEDALYLSKMIVSRKHSGQDLGSAILNWASVRAASNGRRWVRIDVRRDNIKLHRYYLARGFTYVRTYHAPQRRTESGWLAQRPAGLLTPSEVVLSSLP